MAAKSNILYLRDTLQNLVSGMFTSKDKAFSNDYYLNPISSVQAEYAYRGDWIARKAIDIPPYDMVREGREWQAENSDITVIEKEEKRLGLYLKLNRALVRARLYGGSVLVMGVNRGNPDQPLDVNSVRKGDLQYIHALNRYEITAGEIIRDVADPFFGEPKMWEIRSDKLGMMQVHPSRIVRWTGPELPSSLSTMDCWGDSVLQAIDDAVKNASLVQQTIASMAQEAKIDVVKVPNLMENLTTADYTARLTQRFSLANQLKSTMSMLLLDAEEEWERKEMNFSQLPDILRVYLQIVSGAADIPATRMLGQSPGGLNATGDSDIRNYYDRLSADQRLFVTPNLDKVDEVLIRSALGSRPADIYYEWTPLWQMSETEKATIDKSRADTSKVYADSGLVPIDALARGVTNQLIENGTYPGLEAALAEAEQEPEEYVLGNIAKEEEAAKLAAKNKLNNNVVPFKKPASGALGDAEPRTLYVRRDVRNANSIIDWAKAQGFKTTLPASDMHITVCYSKTPVDWMKVGQAWEDEVKILRGGPRLVEKLGTAIVLLFASSSLSWRHASILAAGASSDYEEFQPHITITYDPPEGLDLNEIEPYRGPILLGPEIFEEIDEEYKKDLVEDYKSSQPRVPSGAHGGEWKASGSGYGGGNNSGGGGSGGGGSGGGETSSASLFEELGDRELSDLELTGKAASAVTGEKFSATLYRGSGTINSRIPSQYGEGQHWSPNKYHAATYGTKVAENKITLNKPYVYDLPGKKPYKIELKNEFGTHDPKQITKGLMAKGHDGLVVRNVPINRYPVAGKGAEIILF